MEAKRWFKRVAAASFLLLIAALVIVLASSFGDRGLRLVVPSVQERLTAAAQLENSRLDEAMVAYRSLKNQDPTNEAVITNLAVALVSKLKDQAKVVEDTSADDKDSEAAKQARNQFNRLIDEAKFAIELAMKISKSKSAPYQLAIELESIKLSLQSKSDSDVSLVELIGRIGVFDKATPGDPYLATVMPDLIDKIPPGMGVLKREATFDAVQMLRVAFEKHPRNLYVLNRLISLMTASEDASALDYIDEIIPLCKPLGIQGAENEVVAILQEAKQAKSENPDLAMALLEQSQNLIVRTSAFRADERATRPNLLALIDFSDIQKSLQASVDKHISTSTLEAIPKFEVHSIADDNDSPVLAQAVCWFDWNIDLEPELLWVHEKTLSMGHWESTTPKTVTALASLDVPDGVHTILPVDLFEVQFATRPQRAFLKRKSEMAKLNSTDQIEQILDRRADTIRDIVLVGSNGIQLVTLKEAESPTDVAPFQWRLVQESTGLEDITTAEKCLPMDWDADGDLDLVVASNHTIVLMQNRGNRTFDNVNAFSSLPDDSFRVQAMSVCDYDRDQDLDLLVSSTSGKPMGLLENILHGQFRFRALEGEWGAMAGATSLAVAELDGNVSWDWLATTPEGLHAVYTSTTGVGRCQPTVVIKYPMIGLQQVNVADFNNDGATDALLWGGIQTSILWNNRGVGFLNAPTNLLSDKATTSSMSVADIDQDGSLDVAAVVDGNLRVILNEQPETHRYTQVRLKGINDENGGGRVNQYAIGSLVELFSPDRYQAQIVKDDFCHFGLGTWNKPYDLRVVFTNGLTQNVLNPPINTVIEEKQLLKGSCPFAYGWDGTKWQLITDLLWNAPLGLQIARGKTLPDRRWEHLLVPGSLMQPRRNGYELRVTEELWETAYFDQIELTAVDHPVGTWLYSNEKVGPPSIAEPKLWLVDTRIPITSIVGADQGAEPTDWTRQLSSIDEDYAIPFSKRHCQGNVLTHYLELDLSDIPDVESAQLYLTGWIFPTDTSLNIGLDQNPDLNPPSPPSLWSTDGTGEFTCVRPFMGFPGGKPKTIVIPLHAAFQSNDRRLRIETSCEIYWDEMFVSFGIANDPRLSIEKLSLDQAELRYRGFSETKARRPDQHHNYDYQAVTPHAAWPPMDGLFTDYGSVLSLLEGDDDRLVVMGSGDEMQLRFASEGSVEGVVGIQRDFILSSVGWDKDADLNTLEGQSSLPLPFAAMKSYPPPFSQHAQSVSTENLNRETMHRTQNYHDYWHR